MYDFLLYLYHANSTCFIVVAFSVQTLLLFVAIRNFFSLRGQRIVLGIGTTLTVMSMVLVRFVNAGWFGLLFVPLALLLGIIYICLVWYMLWRCRSVRQFSLPLWWVNFLWIAAVGLQMDLGDGSPWLVFFGHGRGPVLHFNDDFAMIFFDGGLHALHFFATIWLFHRYLPRTKSIASTAA